MPINKFAWRTELPHPDHLQLQKAEDSALFSQYRVLNEWTGFFFIIDKKLLVQFTHTHILRSIKTSLDFINKNSLAFNKDHDPNFPLSPLIRVSRLRDDIYFLFRNDLSKETVVNLYTSYYEGLMRADNKKTNSADMNVEDFFDTQNLEKLNIDFDINQFLDFASISTNYPSASPTQNFFPDGYRKRKFENYEELDFTKKLKN